MTQTISLLGQLQRTYDQVKIEYSIHLNNPKKSNYLLGKLDGIELAIKVLVSNEGEN